MQTTGHRVRAAAELAAGVQDGQDDLDGRDALGRVDADRDATAVVDHADTAVFTDGDVDGVAVPGEGFVDGVVDDLLDQVVQTAGPRRTDVHTGTLADRLEPLEHLNLVCSVGRFALRGLRVERVLRVVFRF